MRIFHALFSDERGGLEQAFLDYSRAMKQLGHELTLLVHEKTPYQTELTALKANIVKVAPRGFYDLGAAWQLRRAIDRGKPNLVIAHNSRAVSLLHKAMIGLGAPLIGVSHSYKTRRMMKASALITLTEHMQRHFIAAGYPENRCLVVQNMIQPVDADVRPMAPVPVIGGIGRLVYEKGFHLLVQAMAELARRGVICRALIAGDGQERAALERFAADIGVAEAISWAGWVKDKKAFYDLVDVVALPSLAEPFGLVVLEAMNYAKPVIASNSVGPASIINHGANGLLFESGDVLALADGLEMVLRDADVARRLALAGKQRALDYSPQRFAEALERAIQTIVPAPSR